MSIQVDGWLQMGDLARRDDEGFIYVGDRENDLIILVSLRPNLARRCAGPAATER
ncbi:MULTISPECIES: hypothetical protein [Burkholderia cepacia complex]|nr:MULTISPECIES: hypothetical protein [Burkholderia cepacia complex]